MSKISNIIWDWNGTLLNDVDISIKSIDKVLSEYNCLPIKEKEVYRNKFCFPIERYYKNIGFDFDKTPFTTLGKRFIDIYTPLSRECILHKNALKVLQTLNEMGLKQIILSASQIDNLIEQVNYYHIAQYFDKILGIEDIYGKTKVNIAKKWIADNNINPQENLFIGDTEHDFEVAQAINCKCILFSNGHQSVTTLTQTGGEIIDDLSEIICYLEQN